MKENLWKIVILSLLGILPCQFEILGCFPFLVAYFTAVFMLNENRFLFVVCFYAWMFLWLPVTSMMKYGVILAVIIFVIFLAEHTQSYYKASNGAILSGLTTILVSYGGEAMSVFRLLHRFLPLLEGILAIGLSLLLHRELSLFMEWQIQRKRPGRHMEGRQVERYAKAMGGLSGCISKMSHEGENQKYEAKQMQKELAEKICINCGQAAVCQSNALDMPSVIKSMLDALEKFGRLDDEITEKMNKECVHAKEMMQEATAVFDRAHLNMAWYQRLVENREMIAGQMDAMAEVIKQCMEEEESVDEEYRFAMLRLQYHLREHGVKTKRLHVYRIAPGPIRLTVELAGKWGSCVPVSELLPIMEHYCKEQLIPISENRSIVGREWSEYVFVSKPRYECEHRIARMVKDFEEISGDNFSAISLREGKWMFALSDGMGTGFGANRESETVIELIEQFMEAGFSAPVALRLMNAAMVFGQTKEQYSTLDLCVFDGYRGLVEIYKVGGYVSFIKKEASVEIIGAESLPVGASIYVDTTPWRGKMEEGDVLVMITDGVLEYLHVFDPIAVVKEMIAHIEWEGQRGFPQRLLERIMIYTGGKVPDDMTVLAVHIRDL